MNARRTYWHLEDQRRVPSAYEIGTSRLLYNSKGETAVATPVADWCRHHQSASPLATGLDGFRDPRETTYATYVALAQEKETFVDGLLRAADDSGYDDKLPAAWLDELATWLPVLLYPCHGLQMVAAYLGQLAPTSEIVVGFALQAGDEIRRIQRLAYRVKQLERRTPSFAEGKARWQEAPEWQPLRRVVEELLVTYDFGDALVAHGLVVKPLFDALFMDHAGRLAEARQDPLLSGLLFSLNEDCRWHERFTDELMRAVIAGAPGNDRLVSGLVREHYAKARAAVVALAPLHQVKEEPFSAVLAGLDARLAKRWRELGLRAEADA